MAIRFTFTLNDADAENLFSILQSEKCRMLDQVISETIADNRPAYKHWYRDQSAYIQRMIDHMLSVQVKEADSSMFDLEEPEQPPQNSPGEPLFS